MYVGSGAGGRGRYRKVAHLPIHQGVVPVDMARLREASLGDRRFLHELIALFLEDTPRQLTALRESIEEADLSALHRGAHRLKGAGTNLGAQVFAELCLKLEQLGKQGNLKEAPAVFHDLQEEYARLQDFLNGL